MNISLPVFNRLSVSGYAMFPGEDGTGVDLELAPGLTLVLGANGLGKTTLVTMLYRLLTGPYDMRSGGQAGDLGSRNIEAVPLNNRARRIFASRVPDGASDSSACLSVTLGPSKLEITRALSNLRLTHMAVDGVEQPSSEDAFQQIILNAACVTSFGDWLLLLRHLVFYFEDRRALVWDPSAQRQLLRLLFLSTEVSDEWKERERAILSLDSRMRNLRAALSREQAAADDVEVRVRSSGEVRAQIDSLQQLQKVDRPILESLEARVVAADEDLQAARLGALTGEMESEHAYRDLERLQLLAIEGAFPSSDESARYLYAKLFSDGTCLACGTSAPASAAELQERVARNRCVVCASELASQTVKPISPAALGRARAAVAKAETSARAAAVHLEQRSGAYREVLVDFRSLSAQVARRDAELDALAERLPPEEAALLEQQTELTSLRARVAAQTQTLAELRAEFVSFIDAANRRIARSRKRIAEIFHGFAGDFLLDECRLVWSIQRDRLGESGDPIEFPGFELDLTSPSRTEMTRRDSPEQVSESQREFIDLAFRMTLMSAATREGAGSLVIDAPESSLDAIFVNQAADVLSRFATTNSTNRLVITSNLIEGDLIPALMRNAGVRSVKDQRVVDLLKIATPTAAVRNRREEYEEVRRRLYQRARKPR